MRAVLVFSSGEERHPLGRYLKDGFSHVFAVVLVDDIWIRIDAQIGVPVVDPLAGVDWDPVAFYEDNDCTVIDTMQGTRPVLSPLMINNCVGLVKAVLCIRAPWAQTPWQLYNHLKRRQAHANSSRLQKCEPASGGATGAAAAT